MMSATLTPVEIAVGPIQPKERAPVDSSAVVAGLCDLLSVLDHRRETLEGLDFEREPDRCIARFRAFAEILIGHAERNFEPPHRASRLAEVIAEFRQLTDALAAKLGKKGLFGRRPPDGFGENLAEIVLSLNRFHEMMFLQLAEFTERIADRKLARFWVESAAVFCVDVRRLLRSYQLTESEPNSKGD